MRCGDVCPFCSASGYRDWNPSTSLGWTAGGQVRAIRDEIIRRAGLLAEPDALTA
jgi:hypothetical protein